MDVIAFIANLVTLAMLVAVVVFTKRTDRAWTGYRKAHTELIDALQARQDMQATTLMAMQEQVLLLKSRLDDPWGTER